MSSSDSILTVPRRNSEYAEQKLHPYACAAVKDVSVKTVGHRQQVVDMQSAYGPNKNVSLSRGCVLTCSGATGWS
jgi:hypothetical protein